MRLFQRATCVIYNVPLTMESTILIQKKMHRTDFNFENYELCLFVVSASEMSFYDGFFLVFYSIVLTTKKKNYKYIKISGALRG
jgi:hypothetical protein